MLSDYLSRRRPAEIWFAFSRVKKEESWSVFKFHACRWYNTLPMGGTWMTMIQEPFDTVGSLSDTPENAMQLDLSSEKPDRMILLQAGLQVEEQL